MSANNAFPNWGRCAFCGDYKRFTDEHIWPQWLTPHMDFTIPTWGRVSFNIYKDRDEQISLREGQGDPRRQPVGVVCGDCNHGWMSGLQTAVKPHLLPMIQGEAVRLPPESQEIVAAWVTMAVMASEYFFEGPRAVPPVERLSMKLACRPLKTWKIWAAHHERGEWAAHLVRNSRALSSNVRSPKPDTQATTFCVGRAFFHAFSCPSIEFIDNLFIESFDKGAVAQIWPPVDAIDWPLAPIDDSKANAIAAVIFNALSSPDEPPRPPPFPIVQKPSGKA